MTMQMRFWKTWINEEQENMIPHYEMFDSSTQSIVVMPAIDDDYLEVE